jgi:hypothetical protein
MFLFTAGKPTVTGAFGLRISSILTGSVCLIVLAKERLAFVVGLSPLRLHVPLACLLSQRKG